MVNTNIVMLRSYRIVYKNQNNVRYEIEYCNQLHRDIIVFIILYINAIHSLKNEIKFNKENVY